MLNESSSGRLILNAEQIQSGSLTLNKHTLYIASHLPEGLR